MLENRHSPVLLQAILSFFETDLGDKLREFRQKNQQEENFEKYRVLDGTFGGGGYSLAFEQFFNQLITKQGQKSSNLQLEIYACDLDIYALDLAKEKMWSCLVELKQANFKNYIQNFSDNSLDFIVLDLGFSGNQLNFSNRGFSYQQEQEILDLRYCSHLVENKLTPRQKNREIRQITQTNDENLQPCWQKLYNLKNSKELQKIIYSFSQEKLAYKIADSIFKKIQKQKLTMQPLKVGVIVQAILEAIPKQFIYKKNAILSRVWQALRIWTNGELENLQEFLNYAVSKLKSKGKLAIVSFHSLEDKIVTNFMRKLARPQSIDEYGNTICKYKLLTKKAIKPLQKEIEKNKSSRSARLRVLEKT